MEREATPSEPSACAARSLSIGLLSASYLHAAVVIDGPAGAPKALARQFREDLLGGRQGKREVDGSVRQPSNPALLKFGSYSLRLPQLCCKNTRVRRPGAASRYGLNMHKHLPSDPSNAIQQLIDLQCRLVEVSGESVSAVWPVYQVARAAFCSFKEERDRDFYRQLETLYAAAYDTLMGARVRSIGDAVILLQYMRDNKEDLRPDVIDRILAVLGADIAVAA